MAEEVRLGPDAHGRPRDFWAGFFLALVTLGLYELWWYYRLNDELRAVGRLAGAEDLARTSPALSVSALALGFFAVLPDRASAAVIVIVSAALLLSVVSQYRFGLRIRRAQEELGVPEDRRFNRWAILLAFPGNVLLIPYVFWFAYVTRHQNAVLEVAAELPQARAWPVASSAGV